MINMKNLPIIFIYIISTLISSICFGQTKSALNDIEAGEDYIVWIYPNNNHFNSLDKGFLYKTLDDSLILSNYKRENQQAFAIKDIGELKLRDKTKLNRNIAFGAIGGLFLGGILGFSQEDTKSKPGTIEIIKFRGGTKALVGAIGGVTIGSVIGVLAGSARISIPINGDKSKYNLVRAKLQSISKMN